jgi:hypothetical protein
MTLALARAGPLTITTVQDRPRTLAAERKRRERQRTRDGVQLFHLALDPDVVAEALLATGAVTEHEALSHTVVEAALEAFVRTTLTLSRVPSHTDRRGG